MTGLTTHREGEKREREKKKNYHEIDCIKSWQNRWNFPHYNLSCFSLYYPVKTFCHKISEELNSGMVNKILTCSHSSLECL